MYNGILLQLLDDVPRSPRCQPTSLSGRCQHRGQARGLLLPELPPCLRIPAAPVPSVGNLARKPGHRRRINRSLRAVPAQLVGSQLQRLPGKFRCHRSRIVRVRFRSRNSPAPSASRTRQRVSTQSRHHAAVVARLADVLASWFAVLGQFLQRPRFGPRSNNGRSPPASDRPPIR